MVAPQQQGKAPPHHPQASGTRPTSAPQGSAPAAAAKPAAAAPAQAAPKPAAAAAAPAPASKAPARDASPAPTAAPSSVGTAVAPTSTPARPPAMWSWLWQSNTFSDVTLKLVAAPAAPASPHKKPKLEAAPHQDAACGAGKALLELPAHRVVLGSASNHFKERLVAWGEQMKQQHERQQQQRQQPPPDGGAVPAAPTDAAEATQQQDSAAPADGTAATAAATSNGGGAPAVALPAVAVLEEEVTAEQLPAARAALEFMYMQALPKGLDTMTVVMVARLADQWGMPQCMQACMAVLSALKPSELPAHVIGSILSDDVPKAVMEQPGFTPLLAACRRRLSELFGSAQAVLLDDQLRASFTGLPFSALRMWAQMDELQVDNENSVALLLAHWWNAHYPAPPSPPTSGGATAAAAPLPAATAAAKPPEDGAAGANGAKRGSGAGVAPAAPAPAAAASHTQQQQQQQREQKEQMSTWVRVNQLSATYFVSVLPQLPWWAPPQEPFAMLSIARALHASKGASLQPAMRGRLPAAWLAKPRAKDPAQVVQLSWVVSAAELESLHRNAGTTRAVRESPGLCWCGYMWHLCLSLNSQKDALWLGAKVRTALPSAYQMPVIMEAKFTLAVKEAATGEYSKKETLNFGDGAALQPGNCNGSPRLLNVPAATAPRASSLPPPALMHDGKLSMLLVLESMQ